MLCSAQVRPSNQRGAATAPPPLVWTQFPAGLLAGPRLVARGQISGDGQLTTDTLAAVMADGWVEIHDPNAANLLARFRPLLANEVPLFPSDIAAGLDTVMDRCVKIEHARILGGLNWAGVNTGVISAKRPKLHA